MGGLIVQDISNLSTSSINSTMTDSLLWRITQFARYLERYEYDISSGMIEDVISYIGATNATSDDLMDYEPVLRCFFVKNMKQEENFLFHLYKFIYPNYEKDQISYNQKMRFLSSLQHDKNTFEQSLIQMDKSREMLKRKLSRYEDKLKKGEEVPVSTVSKMSSLEKKLGQGKADFDALAKKSGKPILAFIQNIPVDVSGYSLSELNELENALKDMLRKAMITQHPKQIMTYVMELLALLKKARSSIKNKTPQTQYEQTKQQLQELEQSSQAEQQRLDQLIQNLTELEREITKLQPVKQHRDRFLTDSSHYKVHSEFAGELDVPDKVFEDLTEKEKREIQNYIRDNAQQFRTRLTHNIRTIQRKRLDIAETCKKACGTNGIPLKLIYEKPVARKTKLVLFLDVSGSCKEASTLMLNFMYYMQDVFPGGCKLYAFVNSLYDISALMRVSDCENAIQNVLCEIPRRGVYSDYGQALQEFWSKHSHEITKDTLVFFIGDARNNQNESGEDIVKAISRKARKVYWMNTDRKEKCNQGDSIIAKYLPYITSHAEVITPLALLKFLFSIH